MKKFILLLICTIMYMPNEMTGQMPSGTLGNDFYVAFGDATSATERLYKLQLVIAEATPITIKYGDGSFAKYDGKDINGIIPFAAGVYDILLDQDKVKPSAGGDLFIDPKAVHVTSSAKDILLYALTLGKKTGADATVVLPVSSLTKEYIISSHLAEDKTALLSIVATDVTGITKVTVTKPDGSPPQTYDVDPGKILQIKDYDLTGIKVTADKPVAVFASAKEAKILGDRSDNLFEQIWPLNSWGKEYIVPVTGIGEERVRILAREAGDIRIKVKNLPDQTITLAAGEHYDFTITDVTFIDSDVPISVNSFMLSNDASARPGNEGDPSQCWINPVEQMAGTSIISPFYMNTGESSIGTHDMIIVTRTEYAHKTQVTMCLKGTCEEYAGNVKSQKTLGEYTITTLELANNGSDQYYYTVQNPHGANTYIYGYGEEESYQTSGGSMVWSFSDGFFYFTIDDIYYTATTCESNSYFASGKPKITRYIDLFNLPNYANYDKVKWHVSNTQGSTDITDLTGDDANKPEDFFIMSTDIRGSNNYGLEYGKNYITMEIVYKNGLPSDIVQYGMICVMQSPEPKNDFAFIYGTTVGFDANGNYPIQIHSNDDNVGYGVFVLKPGYDVSKGQASIDNKTLLFKPEDDFIGIAEMEYCIIPPELYDANKAIEDYPAEDIGCATVTVVVTYPLVDRYEACPGSELEIGMRTTPGVKFRWYNELTNPINVSSYSNTISVTASKTVGRTDTTFYARPFYESSSVAIGTEMIPVKVYINTEGCGVVEVCSGSILYSENFGGNNDPDSENFANQSAKPVTVSLSYGYATDNAGMSSPGHYTIAKEFASKDNHTTSSPYKGRMLVVRGGTNPTSQDIVMRIPVGDLCKDMEYSFSAWIMNLDPAVSSLRPSFTFVLIDKDNNNEIRNFSAQLHDDDSWRQYGFTYTPDADLDNLELIIRNNPVGTGSSGNLYAIDDVTIALCTAAEATITVDNNTICAKEDAAFEGTFTGSSSDIGSSSGNLISFWQYSENGVTWTVLPGTGKRFNHSTGTSAPIPYTLTRASLNDAGYYRMGVGTSRSLNQSGNNVTVVSPNCIVYSEPEYLKVDTCFKLQPDTVYISKNETTEIDVLKNDIYPCNTPGLRIKNYTAKGTGRVTQFLPNEKIQYTPPTGFIGIDTVEYEVTCTFGAKTITKDTTLYVIVAGPQQQPYEACVGVSLDLVIETTDAIKTVITYEWYMPDGSPVTTPNPSNILNITTPSTPGRITYKVQPLYNGIAVGNKIPVNIDVKNCIYEICSGTVIFKDDFGGNDPSDTYIATSHSSSVPSSLSFYNMDQNVPLNNYSILKSVSGWGPSDDHTYESDSDRGYFMLARTDVSDQVYYNRNIDLGRICYDTIFSINVWLKNLGTTVPNVRIVVTDIGGVKTYADVQTGSISTSWKPYGVKIPVRLLEGSTSIKVELSNAVAGEVVLAIDDISVSVCSDEEVEIKLPVPGNQCEGQEYIFDPNLTNTDKYKFDQIFGVGKWFYRWECNVTGHLNDPSDPWHQLVTNKTSDTWRIPSLKQGNVTSGNEGFYRLVVSHGSDIDLIGCRIASEPVELKVLRSPKIVVSGNEVACSGGTTTLKAETHPSRSGDVYRYNWYNMDGTMAWPGDEYVITPTAPIDYRLVATGDNGCEFDTVISVKYKKIDLTITPVVPNPVCFGKRIYLQANSIDHNIDSCVWYYIEGVDDTVVIEGHKYMFTAIDTADKSRKYYVTVRNSDGCKATETIDVAVYSLPRIIINRDYSPSPGESMCDRDTLELRATGAVTYRWNTGVAPYDSILIWPGYSPTPYKYWVIGTDANGCEDTAKYEVTVKDLPVVSISGPPINSEICGGQEVVLTAVADHGASGATLDPDKVSYLWDHDPYNSITPVDSKMTTIKVKPKQTTTYTVTVTNLENGCSVRDSIKIKVNPLPEIYPLPEDTIICAGRQTVLKAQLIDPKPAKTSTYKWTFNNQIILQEVLQDEVMNASTLNLFIDEDGYAAVTVTSMAGCIVKDSTKVRILPKLVVNIEGSEDEICYGDTVTLTASAADTYQWEWLNLTAHKNDRIIKVSPEVPMKYIVKGTDYNGCWAYDTFEIKKVRPLPKPEIKWTENYIPSLNNSPIICASDTIELVASVPANPNDPDGNTTYIYKWEDNWRFEQTLNRDTVRVWPRQDTVYTVTTTSQYGCSADTSIKVTVNGGTPIILETIEPVCEGTPARLTAQTTGEGLTYEWSTGATTQNIVIDNPKNWEKVWVSATNINYCKVTTDTILIQVVPSPAVSIEGPDEVCAGNEIMLIALGGPDYTWEWKDTNITNNTIYVVPELNSEYIVFGTDGYGCTGTDTIKFEAAQIKPALNVKIEFAPDVFVANNMPEICAGDTLRLEASADGGSGDYSYVWLNNLSTSKAITVKPERDSTFRVRVTDNISGCYGDTLITVKVNPLPNIAPIANETVCLGGSVTLTTVNVDNAPGLTYLWSTGSNTSEIVLTPNQPKDTIVWVEVTDNSKKCTYRSNDIVVKVVPPPVVQIVKSGAICSGKEVTLTAIGALSYEWSTGATSDEIVVKSEENVTYTVTGTDNYGCTATASYTIGTVNTLPTPVITTTNHIINDTVEACSGSSLVLTVEPSSGYEYWWDNNFATASITITPTEEITSYKVIVTDPITQCEASDSITVKLTKAPEFYVTPDTTICPNQSIVILARGPDTYQYVWTDTIGAGHTIGNTKMLTRTFTEIEAVTLTVTDLNQCTATRDVVVRVLPSFAMTVSGKQEICLGEEVTLTASPAAFYKWNTGETTKEIKVRPDQPATYYVTGINSYRCEATDTFKITTVHTLPTAKIIAPDVPVIDGKSEICEGQNITLEASATGGSGVYNFYSWINNSHPNASITVAPDRDSTFKVIVTDDKSCVDTASIDVRVNKAPKVDVIADTIVCPNIPVNISAKGPNTYKYVWTDTVGVGVGIGDTIGLTNMLTHTFAETEEVTLTVTDLKQCTTERKVVIEVSQPFTMTITGKQEICFGEEVTLTASDATSYLWSPSNETTKEIKVRPNMPATYSVIGYNNYGCIATDTFKITTVHTLPTANIIAPDVPVIDGKSEICEGQNITLEASATGGSGVYSSYSWVNNSSPYASITVTPDRDSTFKVIVTDDKSCVDTASIDVRVNKAPEVYVTADTTVCPNQPVVISARGLNTYQYVWTDTIAGDTIGLTNMLTRTFTATEQVKLTVTDSEKCVTEKYIVARVLPTFTMTITGKQEACYGEEVTLTASEATSYLWNNGKTTKEIKVYPDMPATYSVIGYNSEGCMATDTFKITTVYTLPTASIIAPDVPVIDGKSEICEGQNITLEASASGGSGVYSSYSWVNNLSPNASITVTPDRDSTFKVTVTDSKGCVDTASIDVKVNKAPEVYVTADTTICPNQPIVISAKGLDEYQYIWTDTTATGDTIGRTNMLTRTFTTTEQVKLTVTDLNKKCITEKYVVARVLPTFAMAITGKQEICFGEEVTLTASDATSYLWNTGEDTKEIKVRPDMPATYIVTGYNSHGCMATDTFKITTVYSLPKPVITVPDLGIPIIDGRPEICEGESIPLAVSATGGSGVYNFYSWTNNSSPDQLITVTPDRDSVFTVTVTDSKGCSADTSITVKVNRLPVIKIANDTVCYGNSVTLSAVNVENEIGLTYLWSTGSTMSEIVLTPDQPKDTIVWVEVSGSNNRCTYRSNDILVKVVTPPIVEIIEPEAICSGTQVTLKAIGAVEYKWSTGETGDEIVVEFDKTDITYIVTGFDNFGCTATDSYTIDAISLSPVPKITTTNPIVDGKVEVCVGSSLELTVELSELPSNYDYWWGTYFSPLPSITVTPPKDTTYTVIVTDKNTGCSAPASIMVKLNKTPEVYVPADTTVCPNQPIDISAQGLDTYKYVWTDTIGAGHIIGETNMLTRIFTATEEVTLTVTDSKQCVTEKKVVVGVFPSFAMTVSGKQEICFGEEVTLTASEADSYLWNTGETTKEIKVRPDMPATYYVTGANSRGCVATATFEITTVHTLPTAEITAPDVPVIDGKSEICEGQIITLEASATGGSGVYSLYSWVNNSSPDASITVTPDRDSTFKVAVTDSKGCRDTASIEVRVNKAPEVYVPADTTVCPNQPIIISAQGLDTYKYVWTDTIGAGHIVGETNMLTRIFTATEEVTLTITDSKQCTTEKKVVARVLPSFTMTVSGKQEICFGEEVTLTASEADSYLWNTGETTKEIKVRPDMPATYSVTGANSNGCMATGTFEITTVNSLPTPNITAPVGVHIIEGKPEICEGQSITLEASATGGSGVYSSYSWVNNSHPNASITVTPVKDSVFKVIVTDDKSCRDTASIEVRVNKAPEVYVIADTTVCPNQPIVISAQGLDTYKYVWTDTVGAGHTVGETKMLTRTFTATEEVTLTVTDSKQCTAEKKVVVRVLPSFVMTVSGKHEICFGEEVTLTASEADSYLWNTGEVTKEIKVRPDMPATYSVTGYNSSGCMATDTFKITTVHSLPIPAITAPVGIPIIEGKPEICQGQSITLEASATGGSGVYSFYSWKNNSSPDPLITVTPNRDSVFTVTVTDSKGCSADTSITVKIYSLPGIEHIENQTICEGGTVVLTAKVEDEPGYFYNWYEWVNGVKTQLTGKGTDARELVLTPVQNQMLSVEIYSLDINNNGRCTAKQEDILITVVPPPVIYIMASKESPETICSGEKITLTAYGAITYVWSTGETSKSIEVTPDANSTYWVEGSDSYGCKNREYITITNIQPPLSPTINIGANSPILGVSDGKPEICAGSSIELVASANDLGGIYTYHWTHNSSDLSSVTVTPEAGETKYSVTITDNNGCSTTDSITVRAISLPELEPLDDMIICPNQPFIINAKATGLGLKYLWSTGEISATIEIDISERQDMWVEVTNLKNCMVREEFAVDVLPSLVPKMTVIGVNEICSGDEIQLTASGADSYLWNTGETSASIIVRPTAPTTYIVTGTDNGGGCQVTAEYTVSTVKPLPVPGIEGKTNICNGESVTLTASGGSTYKWADYTSFDSLLTIQPEADATYTVTITGDNGCSIDTSITVNVHNYPKVEALVDTVICPNQSIILRAKSEDIGLTYLWSTGDTASVTELTPAETQNVWVEVTNYKSCTIKEEVLIEVLPLPVFKILSDNNNCSGEIVKLFVSGGYDYMWSTGETTDTIYVSPDIPITYQATGTDNYGCPATASYDLNIGALPVAAIEGAKDICYGESTTLTASGGASYKWANNSALSNSILVTPTHDSTFTVRVTTEQGCYADVSKTIKVHQSPLLEPFADTIICSGQHIVLQAKASGMGLTYLWSTGETSDVIDLSPTEDTTIWVTVSNMKHCSVTEGILIEIMPLPPIAITGSQAICAGSELTLTASGAESYLWNTGFTGNEYTVNLEVGDEYTVTGTDKYGCTATVSTGRIVDRPAVAINVNPKTIWDNASDVHFATVTDIKDYKVIWDFGDGVWSSLPEVDHHYHITGNESQYDVVFSIVDKNSCADTIRETINVDIHPATVFFPNLGQTFMNNCAVCQNIEIYDRRGIKVYEGPLGWDGTYKGRLLDPDTYFYVITLKFEVAGTNIRKGYITVGKYNRVK